VFVDLYRQGLIYRDKKLVNWDPHFETAISDLEVEMKEVDGAYWHLRYPLADGVTYEHPVKDAEGNVSFETRDYIVVATSRPETMLGDTAVAVHPDDVRYQALIGREVVLPIVNRRIPIIADEYPDPEKGSGAVKITPAHDFNDFEVGQRHGLAKLNVLTSRAAIVGGSQAEAAGIPERFQGLDRQKARELVVAEFEAAGLLAEVEKRKIEQPFGDRSGVVIEPWLTDQWYVDAKALAVDALAAVKDGRTRFVPENWEKTYFHWMENIQPWCISRQLWWGHRIPVWYGSDGEVFCAEDEAGAQGLAGPGMVLRQDEDVLDTWFSSALWPFSTLGWPEDTAEMAAFYPNAVLVTAFDIIFFWVARMMMTGLHFTGQVPFKDVYIHALVLDEKGQKMSKTKGNVIDPLELINEVGADALRFTLASLAAQGRNIRLSKQRVEGNRNFITKLWNAARFGEMNAVEYGAEPGLVSQPINRWIMGEAARAAKAVTQGLEAYRFNEAAGAAYKFVWNVYCDWYLELIKPLLMGEDEASKAETRRVAGWTFDRILQILHPFMPFVTEELWERLAPGRAGFLMLSRWPEGGVEDAEADAELGWVIEAISGLRGARGDVNVPAGTKVPLVVAGADDAVVARVERYRDLIMRLARLDGIRFADAAPRGSVTVVAGGATLALEVAGAIDPAAERARLSKEIARLEGEIAGIDKKLGNEAFLAKAPAEVVDEQNERRAEAVTVLAKLSAARTSLEALG
jgi:valyl-tRNA synthetase